MSYLYNTFLFKPLFNGLITIIKVIPGIDLGIAVIIFTILIRLILFPMSKSAILTQVKMKEIEPEVSKIRKQYSSDRQTQALKTMELYKERGVKPFSGILLLLIQIPILLALISVFYKITPPINPDLIYSFLQPGPEIYTTLLGLSLSGKSLILALATGIAQYLQLHYSVAARQHKAMMLKANPADKPDFSSQLATSMHTQMKYFLPVLAFASVYWIIPAQFPGAASIIAIYWAVSALFTLAQEIFIYHKYVPKKAN